MKKEIIVITYSKTYNTRVEYFGSRVSILDMFRLLDVWGSNGSFDSTQESWRFELSEDFYNYAKTEDFKHKLNRVGIELTVY